MTAVALSKAASPRTRLRGSCAVTRGSRGVPATVTLRRTELDDLRDELRAERAEGMALAELAADATRFIEAYYDRPQIVMHHAGRIGHATARFIRQRTSHVL